MAKNQICGVVLPSGLALEARVIAAMQGKSRSKLMRELLEEYLKNQPNQFKTNISNDLCKNNKGNAPQKERET
jgi:metal-responsive CopG/Arc/MetJ family transcriptional regulator